MNCTWNFCKALGISVFICCFLAINGFSQVGKLKITGTVKDSLQAQPLGFCTISISRLKHPGVLIKSTYTNDKGAFELIVDSGTYKLTVSHTGYENKILDIKADAKEPLNLGSISLRPSVKNLQGVTVTAFKPLIEQNNDKIIYNAENDPASKTETAIDILRKTPMVTADGDGNVQVNGQSNFKVLLNGKETSMFAQNLKEALKAFPGALIAKIEVITSPSAKYDAEGVGGIINIITKKKVAGYNGSISTYYSTTNNYSLNGNLNVKAGKFGFTSYFGIGGGINIPSSSLQITTPLVPSVFTKRTLTGSRINSNAYTLGNLELSYEADSLNTITLYGNFFSGNNHSNYDRVITTEYASQPSDLASLAQFLRNTYPSSGIGTDYTRKYKSNPEKELDFRINTQFSRNSSYSTSDQDLPLRDLISTNISTNKEYTVQLDFTQPLTKGQKLETGAKAILRKAESNFESLVKYNTGDDYAPYPSNSDLFNYHQEIYGGYASYSINWKKFNFRAGARLEHTEISGNFVTAKTRVSQSYTNLVPNIQITDKVSKNYTMLFSYNMRLQRASIGNLNPFVSNTDSFNISYGNPNLGPQILHALTFQNRISKGKTFITLALGANYTGNTIVQYSSFDPSTGITSSTWGNYGKEVQTYFSTSLNSPVTQKLNIGLSGLIRYSKIDNTFLTDQKNEGISGNLFGNFYYKVTKLFSISGSGGFFKVPPALANTLSLLGFYQVNFGYKFFHEKLSTTINFNNVQATYHTTRNITQDKYFSTISENTNLYRVFYFGATWNFGKLKENVSKKKGVNNDDLINNSSNN